jgi:hypothetical protein
LLGTLRESVAISKKKNYIDTGKVRFVSRDLPLEFHPFAFESGGSRALCRRPKQILGAA